MVTPVQIQVFDHEQLAFSDEFEGTVELGRQSEPAEDVYKGHLEGDRWRVAIARLKEQFVSRRHALIVPLEGGLVRLTNTSTLIPLTLAGGAELAPQATVELRMPATLSIGRKNILINQGDIEQTMLRSLPESVHMPAPDAKLERLPVLELPRGAGAEIDPESLLRWLRTIMGVLQTAASSSDFFDRAARGVVDIVGLDSGRVLLFEGDGWRVEAVGQSVGTLAAAGLSELDNWRPSRRVLRRLRAERRTFWEEPEQNVQESMSLSGVAAVVAAPILDRQGTVIGALYGERRQKPHGLLGEIARVTELDAMMIELLATSVAAGLARIEQEKAAMAARVQFEQFFTPELARELAVRPDLLSGQERDVTLLFADIRGFSRISERIGPGGTLRWIGDVMGKLSDCILAHSGVLVDYIGDEVIGMWGAPKDEPAHARLACRAALDMLGTLAELNAKWQLVLGEPMALGIGINSGLAQVGNTGSSRKFKYGALGNTVNLASRVQGATKFLKTDLLVTGSTRAQLDSNFAVRLLCRVGVVNIAEPVALYEMVPVGRPGWDALKRGYEEALALFEKQEFRRAARTLATLQEEFPGDDPSLLLLSRVVDCLVHEPVEFDPVWRLSAK
jgi:adenylate cyclase